MAKTTVLSPIEALSMGRDIFLKNWQPVVKLAVVMMVINFFVGFAGGLIGADSGLLGSLVSLGGNLISMYLAYGFLTAMFMIYDKKAVDIQTLAQPVNEAVSYVIGTLLLTFAIGLGMIFFLIPGFYIATKYFFVPTLLVDTKMGVGEAFTGSAKMTEGRQMDLFIYMVISAIAVVIGLLAFIVGAFVVSWMAMFGMIALHRSLVAKAK